MNYKANYFFIFLTLLVTCQFCYSQSDNDTLTHKALSAADVLASYAGITTEGSLPPNQIKNTVSIILEGDSAKQYDIISYVIGGCCSSSFNVKKIGDNQIPKEIREFHATCCATKYWFEITDLTLKEKASGELFKSEQSILIRLNCP